MKGASLVDRVLAKVINAVSEFQIAGTAVTATAAELNKNAGVTGGTVTASKTLVTDANKDLASLRHLTLTGNLVSGSTTLSEADLALVDGLTAGTVTASKAVTVDANKVALGLRKPVVVVTADTTLTEADSGKIIIINAAAAKVLTLPATAAGLTYTLQHQVATTSGAGHAFSPVAADLIRGNGFTPADNKDAICTQATSRIGDSITIVGDGVDGWYITAVTGTWAREA